MKKFQKRLNRLLIENDITLQKLADATNTTKVSISRYKNGHRIPDIKILRKLAKYFGVSADWLIGLSDVRRPSWYDKLPDQLQNFIDKEGIDYIESVQFAHQKGIPPEDIKTIIETFEELKPLLDKLGEK